MEKMIRTFVALPLDDAVNANIDRWVAEHWPAPRFRFVRAGNRHVTLKFLGNVLPGAVDKVAAAIGAAAEKMRGLVCPVVVGELGFFPDAAAARVFWTAVTDETAFLETAFKLVEDELRELGFSRDDRVFHAHVTLARLKDGLGPDELERAARLASSRFGTYRPSRIALYRSELGGTCPVYEELAGFPL